MIRQLPRWQLPPQNAASNSSKEALGQFHLVFVTRRGRKHLKETATQRVFAASGAAAADPGLSHSIIDWMGRTPQPERSLLEPQEGREADTSAVIGGEV